MSYSKYLFTFADLYHKLLLGYHVPNEALQNLVGFSLKIVLDVSLKCLKLKNLLYREYLMEIFQFKEL